MAITTVWIEEGCIICNACEAECPEVFKVTDTSCNVNGSVREDGVDNENRDERAPSTAATAGPGGRHRGRRRRLPRGSH